MAIQLYYAPRTRAGRVRWLLEELEVPYELVRIDLGAERTPEHLAVHPLGKVPALRDGDVEMFESGAICTFLGDKYADGRMAPAIDSPDRAPYLQWIAYTSTTLEQPLLKVWEAGLGRPEGDRDTDAIESGIREFNRVASPLARAVDGRDFIVGDSLTAADVVVCSVLAWGKGFGLLDPHPPLAAYGKRIGSRPAAKRARAD